jgi:hypothetical protein
VLYYRAMRRPIALALILLASLASADPYAVGSALPRIELPDQRGEAHVIDGSVRAIVFSRDMDAGKIVREAVEKAGPDLFSRSGAVYVANVSGMPSLIRALFAMPAMRRRPYAVLVDEDGAKTADFPGGTTHPCVMRLEGLTLTSVSSPRSPEALIALLEPPPR